MKAVVFMEQSDLGILEILICRLKRQTVFVQDWPGAFTARHRWANFMGLSVTNLTDESVFTANVLSMTHGFGLSSPEAMAREVSESLFQKNDLGISRRALYSWLVARYRFKIMSVARLWPWLQARDIRVVEVVLRDGELVKLCSIEQKFQDIKFRRPIFSTLYLLTKTARRVSRGAFKYLKVRLRRKNVTALPRYGGRQQDASGKVIFILHTGLSYGSLYDWGFWFRKESNSPLSQHQVLLATYDDRCPRSINGQVVHTIPFLMRIVGKNSISEVLWIALRASVFRRKLKLLFCSFALAKTCAMAHVMADWLKASFPQLRVALFAYDFLTPRWVSWGLELAGVKTVAAQERPASAVAPWATVSVDSYLVAGPLFAQYIVDNLSNEIRKIVILGQYRTDQIKPRNTNTGRTGLKQVLVLPFHLDEEAKGMFNVTSANYATHFMGEIIRLARRRPDLHFVVRSKSLNLFQSDVMHDTYAAMPMNLELDYNIDLMHSAYRRLQESSLVIGKTTSLIDEALAADIPALHIDYGLWGDREMVDGYTYLPEKLWAQSFEDLLSGLAWALKDEGQVFRRWWSPHRQRIYGDLTNGNVSERARIYVETLLVNDSD